MQNQISPSNEEPDNNEEPDDAYDLDYQQLMAEFEIRFPTDEACLSELLRMVGIDDSTCKECGSQDITKRKAGRAADCRACRRTVWFTSGTIFKRMKKPKPRLAKIWLESHGVSLSGSKFAKVLEVALATGQEIKLWFNVTIEKYLPDDSARFASAVFREVICKRSLRTPPLEHPSKEIDVMEEAEDGRNESNSSIHCSSGDLSSSSTALPEDLQQLAHEGCSGDKLSDHDKKLVQLPPEERKVLQLLSETPLGFDELHVRAQLPTGTLNATLASLELSGLVKYQAGNSYVGCLPPRKEVALTPASRSTVGAFLKFIKTIYHGISRKYLQAYLAVFWYQRNRQHVLIEDIFWKVMRTNPPDTRRQTYLSPFLVKLPC